MRRENPLAWESPDQPEESFGPFGPEVSRRVSDRVSPKTGVSEGVSHGASPGPFGPRAPECQKGVPRVSKRCPDTPGTVSGHLFDTPAPGARRALETPRGTLPRTPPFSGTPCRTLSRTLRARRARKTLLAGRGIPNRWLKNKNPRSKSVLPRACPNIFPCTTRVTAKTLRTPRGQGFCKIGGLESKVSLRLQTLHFAVATEQADYLQTKGFAYHLQGSVPGAGLA